MRYKPFFVNIRARAKGKHCEIPSHLSFQGSIFDPWVKREWLTSHSVAIVCWPVSFPMEWLEAPGETVRGHQGESSDPGVTAQLWGLGYALIQ